VVERRRDARLAQEAPPETVVVRQLGREQLERDVAAEPRVVRAVDDAHPAAAEQRVDAVARQDGADSGVGARGPRHAPSVSRTTAVSNPGRPLHRVRRARPPIRHAGPTWAERLGRTLVLDAVERARVHDSRLEPGCTRGERVSPELDVRTP
jgi:hypothetical protein